MKNITLSADEGLIEAAREKARAEHTTLNAQFRLWLERYACRERGAVEWRALLDRIDSYVAYDGRKITREEMNERPSPALGALRLQPVRSGEPKVEAPEHSHHER